MTSATRSRAWRWLHGKADPRWGVHPATFEPEYVDRVVQRLDRLFGPRGPYPASAHGWNHVPDSPVMIVSNHSAGSTVADCLGFAYAWYRHFGTARALHFLAHELLLATPLTGPFFSRVGVLRASRQRAISVLSKWRRDVMVMPGGDRDAWRPWRDRHRVQFAGHKGYARVALEAGVPIVPVAHAGPHDTLMVLTDGHRIARTLRLHRLFRIDVFPIHLSLPFGLGIGPFPHLPIPKPMRYLLGRPIYPPAECVAGQSPDQDLVEQHDKAVRAALQSLLDELSMQAGSGRAKATFRRPKGHSSRARKRSSSARRVGPSRSVSS